MVLNDLLGFLDDLIQILDVLMRVRFLDDLMRGFNDRMGFSMSSCFFGLHHVGF